MRAWLLQDWSLRRALNFVEEQRPGVSPNAGFMARLVALEERLRGCQSVRVRPGSPTSQVGRLTPPIKKVSHQARFHL